MDVWEREKEWVGEGMRGGEGKDGMEGEPARSRITIVSLNEP